MIKWDEYGLENVMKQYRTYLSRTKGTDLCFERGEGEFSTTCRQEVLDLGACIAVNALGTAPEKVSAICEQSPA
jgi:acetylornithine/succinyldiaminopimelate/putrescine aminotransferase